MRSPQICPYDDWPSYRLVQLFDRAQRTKEITAPDCTALLDALSNPNAAQEELMLIDRLCWAICKGRITMADNANFPYLEKFKSLKPSIRNDEEPHLGKPKPTKNARNGMASAI